MICALWRSTEDGHGGRGSSSECGGDSWISHYQWNDCMRLLVNEL